MQCAVLLTCSAGCSQRNVGVPREKRIEFRIGINVGDIIFDRGDMYCAGLGVEIGGTNYLMPTDIQTKGIATPRTRQYRSIVSSMRGGREKAQARVARRLPSGASDGANAADNGGAGHRRGFQEHRV
jgi:hypothetical protein